MKMHKNKKIYMYFRVPKRLRDKKLSGTSSQIVQKEDEACSLKRSDSSHNLSSLSEKSNEDVDLERIEQQI